MRALSAIVLVAAASAAEPPAPGTREEDASPPSYIGRSESMNQCGVAHEPRHGTVGFSSQIKTGRWRMTRRRSAPPSPRSGSPPGWPSKPDRIEAVAVGTRYRVQGDHGWAEPRAGTPVGVLGAADAETARAGGPSRQIGQCEPTAWLDHLPTSPGGCRRSRPASTQSWVHADFSSLSGSRQSRFPWRGRVWHFGPYRRRRSRPEHRSTLAAVPS